MSDDGPETNPSQLLQLSEEVSRIAGSLTQTSICLRAALQQVYAGPNSNQSYALLTQVNSLIRARQRRASYIAPELIGEPAWDILLELLRGELAYERMSVASVCRAAGVPQSAGLRWLNALEHHGLVLRQGDERDTTGTFVVLSPDASKNLRRYLIEVVGTLSRK